MLSESKISCFIDGSHMNPTDFTVRVIQYAVGRGFDIDEVQMDIDLRWLDSVNDVKYLEAEQESIDRMYEILDALDWTYSAALDYLNDIDIPAGRGWWVEDQSLFLEEGIE